MPWGGRFAGKLYGFPIGGKCCINPRCKIQPIRQYCRQLDGKVNQYVGIAADEPIRLARLKRNHISLLAKYDYTEKMARAKCEEYGLLSPIYTTGTRGGCWFCPNQKIRQFCRLRKVHPELWAELERLSHTPNLCSYGFKYGKTVQDVTKLMNFEDRIQTLF